jgi:hypothetical protein
VLRVLDQPAVLLGLLLALLVGVYLGSAAQALAARALGDPMPLRAGWLKPSPKRQIGIFSAIAFLIVGWGWAEPVPMNDRWRARRFHVATAILVRPLVYALLCLAALGGVRALTQQAAVDVTSRSVDIVASGPGFGTKLLVALAFGFAALCVTSLIPCPPTDLGRVIFTLGGQSHGWQNARYQLEERNFGVGIVLGLLLLPVILPGFPSWVDQLAPQLLRGLASLLGVTVPA